MGTSQLRPETATADRGQYTVRDGTAYLMIYSAVKSKKFLIHGRLHAFGASCAIGSFWDVNPKCALPGALIDEVAAVNDSLPHATSKQRRAHVLRWLGWRLAQLGYPGFVPAKRKTK